ncbi:MAG: hypothetical protein HOW73_22120 [Polyangiaceae bacterium]|nr:hypothetical protein [Polyangiaceae bacterium]
MQIRDPGFFSRGSIQLPPSPHVTPDSLLQELQQAFSGKGYEVYKTALIGADLVLKRSGWTGLALKIKHGPHGTEILFNAFAPSVLVRLLAMGLIPIIILYTGPWKAMIAEFKEYAPSSGLLRGQLHGQGAAPQMGQGYPAQAGYPQQPQQGYAPQGHPPQGHPGQGYGQQPGQGNWGQN